MKNNDWKDRLGVMYSTNPDFQYNTGDTEEEDTAVKAAICALLNPSRMRRQSWLSAGVSWGKRMTKRLEAPLYTLSVSFCK